MKYPQLVPIRAVNAISDWLESRLEQLGVESAQLYSRLLLSLLQTPIQLNDPIEISNLEKCLLTVGGVHRKGTGSANNASGLGSSGGGGGGGGAGDLRRYRDIISDTEKLKKWNAVQCLREIVSADVELLSIQKLIDELYTKLCVIDQTRDFCRDGVESILLTQYNSNRLCSSNTVAKRKQHPKIQRRNPEKSQDIPGVVKNSNKQLDLYFRAFPALSKTMENSYQMWKDSTSYPWPPYRNGEKTNGNNEAANHQRAQTGALEAVLPAPAVTGVEQMECGGMRAALPTTRNEESAVMGKNAQGGVAPIPATTLLLMESSRENSLLENSAVGKEMSSGSIPDEETEESSSGCTPEETEESCSAFTPEETEESSGCTTSNDKEEDSMTTEGGTSLEKDGGSSGCEHPGRVASEWDTDSEEEGSGDEEEELDYHYYPPSSAESFNPRLHASGGAANEEIGGGDENDVTNNQMLDYPDHHQFDYLDNDDHTTPLISATMEMSGDNVGTAVILASALRFRTVNQTTWNICMKDLAGYKRCLMNDFGVCSDDSPANKRQDNIAEEPSDVTNQGSASYRLKDASDVTNMPMLSSDSDDAGMGVVNGGDDVVKRGRDLQGNQPHRHLESTFIIPSSESDQKSAPSDITSQSEEEPRRRAIKKTWNRIGV